MDEELPPGWTDLHLHPVPQAWRPEPDELVAWLQAQGIERLGVVTAHAVADHWDAEDEAPAPLAEHEDLPLAELAGVFGRAAHCTVLLDPADCGLAELVAELQRGRQTDWSPCVATLGYGATSIPDIRLERTAARFAFSLAIGGPGLPHNLERAARAIPRLAAVRAQIEQLSTIFARDFTAHLCIADG